MNLKTEKMLMRFPVKRRWEKLKVESMQPLDLDDAVIILSKLRGNGRERLTVGLKQM